MPPKKSRRRGRGNAGGGRGQHPSSEQKKGLQERSQSTTEDTSAQTCPVCAERASDWAVGQCPHVVCGSCSHRMRELYDRKTCVMCSTALPQVVVVPLRDYRVGMKFEDAMALRGVFEDKSVGMWFVDRSSCQRLQNMRGWMCPHKTCNAKGIQSSIFANARQLHNHVSSEHRSLFCGVCFSGKKSFVCELQLYNMDPGRNFSARLRAHMRKEHPRCGFCKKMFLDDDGLFAHLQENHETCAICERNNRMHEYYENYAQLERHYRDEHYVCREESCRGLVFATQIELQTHEHAKHSDNSRNTRNRALRVNLQQLHGERDARRRDIGSPRDVRIEQERQAARRQAFLSSNVVFNGALHLDDITPANDGDGDENQSQLTSGAEAPPSARGPRAVIPRAPDDGHFHELPLPRDPVEMRTRNATLVRTMRSLADPAAFEQFRMSSGDYHSGKISADEYYGAVTDTFGVRTAIRDILPELVALLPNPILQTSLLNTCLVRTDTKRSRSSNGQAGAGRSSTNTADDQQEQFPTLNGEPGPTRAAPAPMRRLGAPGPEDFPRLGRVNKPQGGDAGPSSSTQGPLQSNEVATRAASNARAGSLAPNSQPQRSAASVLRQAPNRRVLVQNRRAPAGRSIGNSHGVQLPASAFPSLSSVTRSSAASPSDISQRSETIASNSRDEAPPADVSMRVGAVWGGVAGQAHNRRGKRRGPGRGRGRTPASPPKRVLLDSSDIPDIRTEMRSNGTSSESEEQGAEGRSAQSNVLDIMEIAKSRREALQKSSLPRVGGSGYGFAWERKKAKQKRKQIKNDVRQSIATRSGGEQSRAIAPTVALERVVPTVASEPIAPPVTSGPSDSSSTKIQTAESDMRTDETAEVSRQLEDAAIEDKADAQATENVQGEFEPSFLTGHTLNDDPIAAFLGSSKYT